MTKILTQINIDRPLVFLCGVAIPIPSERERYNRDRRVILSKEIISSTKERDKNLDLIYQVMPIIVDEVFQDDVVKKENLNLALLEEIVSAISAKTYVFLDSMSTSYELGLFTNSKSTSDVTVFLADQYKIRLVCPVGEYITKTLEKNIVEYPAEYAGNGYIFFKDDLVPQKIREKLFSDYIQIKANNQNTPIVFQPGIDKTPTFGKINVLATDETISFSIDTKTMFYFVDSVLSYLDPSGEMVITTEKLIDELEITLLSTYINTKTNKNLAALYMLKKPKIFLNTHLAETFVVVNHIFHIIRLFEKLNKRTKGAVNLHSKVSLSYSGFYNLDFFDLLSISKEQRRVLKGYNNNPGLYIRKFTMTIKGKRRQYITYSQSKNGRTLRSIHQKIFDIFRKILPSSDISYAYKAGRNNKMCVEQHLYSVSFYKMDIHQFFNSIKKRLFIRKIYNLLPQIVFTNYQTSYFSFLKTQIEQIFSVCFYKRILPIGFVSSPLISDFFLFAFDEKLKRFTDCVITRYADDILLSRKDLSSSKLLVSANTVKEYLAAENLEMNVSKERLVQFRHQGDSIKFIGINVVFSQPANRLTISKSSLIETSLFISFAKSHPDQSLFEVCRGKCEYIKNISLDSYTLLKKIFLIKTKQALPSFCGR